MQKFRFTTADLDPTNLVSNSQAGQDLFVAAMLLGKKNGTFLEIGAGNLLGSNNTYLLEKTFDWQGFSIDLEDCHTQEYYDKAEKEFWNTFWNKVKDPSWGQAPKSIDDVPLQIKKEIIEVHRYYDYLPLRLTWNKDRPRTKFIQHDALTLDYSFLPEQIDYLQVDIDPPMANLSVLEKVIPKCKFNVITFEHDLWRDTDEVKQVRLKSRIFLQNHGYEMVANDVTIQPGKGWGINEQPIYFEDWYAHPDLVEPQIIAKYRSISTLPYPKFYPDILFEP